MSTPSGMVGSTIKTLLTITMTPPAIADASANRRLGPAASRRAKSGSASSVRRAMEASSVCSCSLNTTSPAPHPLATPLPPSRSYATGTGPSGSFRSCRTETTTIAAYGVSPPDLALDDGYRVERRSSRMVRCNVDVFRAWWFSARRLRGARATSPTPRSQAHWRRRCRAHEMDARSGGSMSGFEGRRGVGPSAAAAFSLRGRNTAKLTTRSAPYLDSPAAPDTASAWRVSRLRDIYANKLFQAGDRR
jgi:hypothetical protein